MNRTPPARPSRTVPILIIGLVLVLTLALIAVVVSGSSDDGDDAVASGVQQQGAVTVMGLHLPAFVGGEDPAVGQVIPTVEGESFSGEPVTISPDDGAQLLVFLAHWCPHCQREVPRLVEQFGDEAVIDGVRVVAVATNTDEAAPNYPPSAWLADEEWPAPVLADDVGNHTAEAFSLSGFPYFVAVAADGSVAARASGEQDTAQVEALLAAARAG